MLLKTDNLENDRRAFLGPVKPAELLDGRSTAIAFLYERNGRFYACGFSGKRRKPDYHYWFRNEAARSEYVQDQFKRRQETERAQRERVAARKATKRGLDVGDILKSSWGWEQTNVDYYQVTGMAGKSMVKLRPIASNSKEDGFMQGSCTPVPDAFTGDEFRRVAKDGSCKINSFQYARKVSKDTAGNWEKARWSSYA